MSSDYYGKNDKNLIKECVEASLTSNYFLHFAGSWHESEMWKMGGILESNKILNQFSEFSNYLKMPVTGNPKGQIKPKIA